MDLKNELEKQLQQLSLLTQNKQEVKDKVKEIQTQLLNNRILEVGFREALQENTEVFSTQQNSNKLFSFMENYPVIKLDLIYKETSTYCPQLAFSQKQSFHSQLEQIIPFIPYLLNHKEVISLPMKIHGKHFKIKDCHQGEEGLLDLVLPENKREVWLCRTKKGITSIIKKFSKWEDALNYTYVHFPFEKI